jgi:hypothetical protein
MALMNIKKADKYWEWDNCQVELMTFHPVDASLVDTEIPIVIVYNGVDHYVPTVSAGLLLSGALMPGHPISHGFMFFCFSGDDWVNENRKQRMLRHIATSAELFPKIQWQPNEEAIQQQ